MASTRKGILCLLVGGAAILLGFKYQDNWPWPSRSPTALIAFGTVLVMNGLFEAQRSTGRESS